jgi:hypothetical protein
MGSDSKFMRDSNGDVAVRVVTQTEALPAYDPDWMFARDENGNIAVRVVVSEGGGGGGGDSHNKGWFTTEDALKSAYATAEDGDYAIVGSTDTIWVWDSDSSDWVDTDKKGQVESVNNKTGAVVLTGADLTTLVTESGATVSRQLASDTIVNCDTVTSLTITLPSTYDAKFISQINFTSGATPTSLTAPNTIVWLGNDITSSVFVPVANKRYAVLFFSDGTNVRGLVQGA